MQAITTTYRGPRGRKQSSVIAKSASGIRLSYTVDFSADAKTNHANAARALALRLEWFDAYQGGFISDDVMAWVPVKQNDDYFIACAPVNA